MTFLENKNERVHNWPFLGHLGLLLAVCQITVIQFLCHCTQRALKVCRKTVENFVRSHWRFQKKTKRVHNWPFPGHLELLLAVGQITDVRFWCHRTQRTLIWRRITAENFVRTVRTVFEKFVKKIQNSPLFGHFWTTFAYVCHITVIQFWSHCTHRTLKRCRMAVENFVRSHGRF